MKIIHPAEALGAPPPEGMLEHFRNTRAQTPPNDYSEKLFMELKKYLLIIAIAQSHNPDVRHSPSSAIDNMWHVFMTYDTRAYMSYCEENLGGYIHHKTGGFYADAPIREIADQLGITLDSDIWFDGDGDCG